MDEQIKQIDELLKVLSRQASYGDSRAANLVPVYKELRQAYVTQMAMEQRITDMKGKLDHSMDHDSVKGIIAYQNDICNGFKARAEAAEKTNAVLQKNVEDAAHALSDVRRFVEAKWMTVADLPSEEAVLFDGPEPKHEADAIIAALNRVAEYYEQS